MTPAESVPAIVVPPLPAEETAGISRDTGALLAHASALVVDTIAADEEAKGLLVMAKKAGDRIEALRKRWTAPLLEQKKLIDGDFKVLAEPVNEAERTLRAKIAAFARSQSEAAEAAMEAAQAKLAEARERDPETPQVAVVVARPPRVTKTENGTVTMRQVWRFEVLDAAALPREYTVPDERAIRAAVRDGVREIPGVRIYAEDEAVVR